MARINIEECWWSDPRRTKLLLKIGFQADAAAVNMWRVAQGFWADGRMLVPKHIFETIEFAEDLLGACLAELRGEFVYVRGSSAWLDWTAEKRAAAKAGGKKSSQRPRNAKGQLQKSSKQSPSKTQAESKLIQASDSDSDSGSGSSSDSIAILEKSPVNPVKFYCDLWKEKNGKSPDIRGKEAGQINQLASDLGIDRACQIMLAYFSMPDPFYIKRGYDVSTMISNLAAIGQFEANGKILTKKVVDEIEVQVDKAQGTARRRINFDKIEAEQAQMRAEAQLQIVGSKK